MPPSPVLQTAWARRASLHASPTTTAYRLLNAHGDGFPNLMVDRFGPALVAHVYEARPPLRPPLAVLRPLMAWSQAEAAYVKYRPVQANVLTETQRALLAPAEPVLGAVLGAPQDDIHILENGLKFAIRPGAGLSVGLFLDMRNLRRWVLAHAAGKTVLNTFAYTCGFGLAALMGQAQRAVNVDASKPALQWGMDNYRLNGLTPDPHDFIFGDVFDWLARFARQKQRFDMVILDPPSYASTKKSRFRVSHDYAALAELARNVTAPGGMILACANARELSQAALVAQLRRAAPQARQHNAYIPALDFPTPTGEEPYLKIVRLDV